MGNRRLLSQALAQPPRMDILYETLSAQSEAPGQPGDHGVWPASGDASSCYGSTTRRSPRAG